MKKFRNILGVFLAAGTLTACASGKTTFSTEVIGEGEGLKLIAENAGKGTAVGTSLDVGEGSYVTVTADVTSGGVQLTLTGEGKSEPSVDFVFTETGYEIEYDLEPGTYTILYTAAENRTTGTVSTVCTPAAAGEEDGQNPIMNFVGTYVKDRCTIEVSAADNKDGAGFHIIWGSGASENSEWDMTGTFDMNTRTAVYSDAVRKNAVYNDDGSIASETVVYENGKGSFTFGDGEATLIWNDEQEHAADDMVFGWAVID